MSSAMHDGGLHQRLAPVVGDRTAKAIERAFGYTQVGELLWHVPRRYSHRGELTPLIGLPVGEHVTVLAQVLDVRQRQMQRRRGGLLEVRITDGIGDMQLTFFNQPWRMKDLVPGVRGIFSGKVSEYRNQLQLQHPDYELFDDSQIDSLQALALDAAAARAFAEQPVPIYPATSTLPTWSIQRAVELALAAIEHEIDDPLPADIRAEADLLDFGTALELVHRPTRTADWQRARDSLRFREAFDLQLALLWRRQLTGLVPSTPRPAGAGGVLARFDARLPFELTSDQREVASTLAAELTEPHPMHRLLQGEVGSGKTVVALRAMLQVAESGGQSALLAPTEVLAAQHLRSVTEMLGDAQTAELQPVLLTSKMPAAERRRALLACASGQSKIVIGTHALLSEQVSFYDLGLIVVDEQHRFGVEQREALRQKGVNPHVLVMTATPIPRTVALTAFGDLETSFIRSLPPGRQGIETFLVPVLERPKWAERAWVRAREEIAAGRQVYVVCPAISASTLEEGSQPEDPQAGGTAAAAVQLANVEETLAELQARPDFAGVRMAALTGAMSSGEKDRVMREFAAGGVDVLVATTVIEVGVNVPNASMMIVRDAERFGVSQLHQLRGRVGRGELPGLCLLLTHAEPGSLARERSEAVADTSDGFVLAERDLELRREGDILGTAQSGGHSTLRLLRVADHGELIERTREFAAALLKRDPELKTVPLLAEQVAAGSREARMQNLAKS